MLLHYRYFQIKINCYGNAKYLQNTYTLETQKVPNYLRILVTILENIKLVCYAI